MEVKKKIESPNKLVSEQAFLAYIAFAKEQDDFDYMTYRFEAASENTKLQIIKAIPSFKNKRDKTKFLNWIVENKPLKFKIEAIKMLLDIDFDFYSSRYKNSTDLLIKNTISHVQSINF